MRISCRNTLYPVTLITVLFHPHNTKASHKNKLKLLYHESKQSLKHPQEVKKNIYPHLLEMYLRSKRLSEKKGICTTSCENKVLQSREYWHYVKDVVDFCIAIKTPFPSLSLKGRTCWSL